MLPCVEHTVTNTCKCRCQDIRPDFASKSCKQAITHTSVLRASWAVHSNGTPSTTPTARDAKRSCRIGGVQHRCTSPHRLDPRVTALDAPPWKSAAPGSPPARCWAAAAECTDGALLSSTDPASTASTSRALLLHSLRAYHIDAGTVAKVCTHLLRGGDPESLSKALRRLTHRCW